MDAQIPQTTRVDRRTATTHVSYDGAPQFQSIDGTGLQYAVNTSSTVLRYAGKYYAVEKGIWYVSDKASGPWKASTARPGDLDLIPPSCPVYNVKFVDIYDVSPDWIYAGYTAGYLNNFIFGPTIVFGTGFYYRPWFGHYYYPRPWTWGFDVAYNPWYGWGFGAGFGFDWFNIGFGIGWGGWYGGWWGPGFYAPVCWGYGHGYHPPHFYGHGIPMGGHGYGGARSNTGIHPPAGSHPPVGWDRQHQLNDRGQWRTQNFRNIQNFSPRAIGGFRPIGTFHPGGTFRGAGVGGRR